MRSLIFVMILGLVGCNSSDDDSALQQQISAIPNEATAIQALRAEVSDMQTSIKKLQLIGHAHGVPSAERVLAIGSNAFTEAVSFGPCTDMGVYEGSTFQPGNGPLGALYQAFKNCTGTHAEYEVDNGALKPANRTYYVSADCTGTAYEWQAGGQGYDRQTLNDGVVFVSPADGSILWVQPGQTPVMTQVQSVYILQNGDCEPDGDNQPMWVSSPTDITKNGVAPNVGNYQLVAP